LPGSRWNRRETNVVQAGYFTVLRSTGFFSALSRLPGGYRYVVKGPATPDVLVKPEGAGTATAQNFDAAQATAPAFETLAPKANGLGLLRLALIALVAAGITALFFLLLHLDSPGG
jgi:hypothetical protein